MKQQQLRRLQRLRCAAAGDSDQAVPCPGEDTYQTDTGTVPASAVAEWEDPEKHLVDLRHPHHRLMETHAPANCCHYHEICPSRCCRFLERRRILHHCPYRCRCRSLVVLPGYYCGLLPRQSAGHCWQGSWQSATARTARTSRNMRCLSLGWLTFYWGCPRKVGTIAPDVFQSVLA